MEQYISISNIQSTTPIIKDYLNSDPFLKEFYSQNYSVDNILKQAFLKLKNYKHRNALVSEIDKQLNSLDLSDKQKEYILNLSKNNTVTITTGHQLNLMTGPLFFVYKIMNVIKLCDELNSKQSEINFVPVFWMATEDHDFEEIKYFNFKTKKIEWNESFKSYAGEIATKSLKPYLNSFYEELKYYPKGKDLRKIINDSYFSEKNLSDATKKLVHELFKDFGLIIIDANRASLKRNFISYIKDDLIESKSYNAVTETIKELKPKYKIQVTPREINFFYHTNKERLRIEKRDNKFYILENDLIFTEEEILKELENHPEKFSPNALMRPVYQEVILPNVAYIGGNAEIAYWMELKHYFDLQKLTFPILIPRNSMLILDNKNFNKKDKWNLEISDLFIDKNIIINKVAEKFSKNDINFTIYEKRLDDIFIDLLKESNKFHKSLEKMILAQQKKQINGLEKVKKRLKRTKKLENTDILNNFENWYSIAFPQGIWQERVDNFSYYYALNGKLFLENVYKNINTNEPSYIILNTNV